MHLDTITLMAADAFVAAIGTMLLIGFWMQHRSSPVLLWWAAATGAQAIGIAGLAVGFAMSAVPAMIVGTGFLSLAPPCIWAGTRLFGHRRVWLPALALGPACWLIAGLVPVPIGPQAAGLGTGFVWWITYMTAASIELWRGRAERLSNRWPLMLFFAIHITVFLVGLASLWINNLPTLSAPPLYSVFGVIYFEQLIFTVGTAIFMVMITRERVEAEYRQASRIDALTGVENRRAFMEYASGALAEAQRTGSPLSLVTFDLDHFKAINDTFGHETGDRVLLRFAKVARSGLRANDMFGRIGGEEFTLVLPGAGASAAFVIADRIREAFAAECRKIGDSTVNATVSAGIAITQPDSTIESLLRGSDERLYHAKLAGRNRVARALPGGLGSESTTVIRVA